MKFLQESVFVDSLGEFITLFVLIVGYPLAYYRQHNCHVEKCWRLQWHTHPDHGHPVCKHHHPHEAPKG